MDVYSLMVLEARNLKLGCPQTLLLLEAQGEYVFLVSLRFWGLPASLACGSSTAISQGQLSAQSSHHPLLCVKNLFLPCPLITVAFVIRAHSDYPRKTLHLKILNIVAPGNTLFFNINKHS